MRVKHLSFTVKDVNKGWSFTAESTLLSQVTFCVVDLETTGSSSAYGGITEIGAVKYKGGEEVSRLSTLVNPGQAMPANIVFFCFNSTSTTENYTKLNTLPYTSLFHPPASASRLAGSIADSTENSREDIGVAVNEVGFGEPPLGDEADVFRYIGVGRAGPLAIHDLVKIVGMRGVRRRHTTPESVEPSLLWPEYRRGGGKSHRGQDLYAS